MSDEHDCGFDGELMMCVEGRVYGPCGRCALVLMRHRSPFTLTDWMDPMIRRYVGRLDGADLDPFADLKPATQVWLGGDS